MGKDTNYLLLQSKEEAVIIEDEGGAGAKEIYGSIDVTDLQ